MVNRMCSSVRVETNDPSFSLIPISFDGDTITVIPAHSFGTSKECRSWKDPSWKKTIVIEFGQLVQDDIRAHRNIHAPVDCLYND